MNIYELKAAATSKSVNIIVFVTIVDVCNTKMPMPPN